MKKSKENLAVGDLVKLKDSFAQGALSRYARQVGALVETLHRTPAGETYWKIAWAKPELNVEDEAGMLRTYESNLERVTEEKLRKRGEIGGSGDVLVEYDSNNSGGRWWLKDKDWEALEAEDWQVDWIVDPESNPGMPFIKGERWLGALAHHARKRFGSMRSGIKEWERITEKNATDIGCSCCGPPHNFRSKNETTGEENYWSTSPPSRGSSYDDLED